MVKVTVCANRVPIVTGLRQLGEAMAFRVTEEAKSTVLRRLGAVR